MNRRFILGCGNFGGIGSAPAFFGQGESENEAFIQPGAAIGMGLMVKENADGEKIVEQWNRPINLVASKDH